MKQSVKLLWTLLSILLIVSTISAERAPKKPFPQAVDFPNCIKPNISQDDMNATVKDLYKKWKDDYLTPSKKTSGGYYIKSGGTGGSGSKSTISEAHGWGMIMFALMAGADDEAQELFDGMVKFAKDHPSSQHPNLMSWEVPEDESSNPTASATDGDFDMAYGLIMAHDQWGSKGDINYISEARKIIAGIKAKDINWKEKRIALGDFVDLSDEDSEFYWATRPSDWMANHLRLFSYNTNEKNWLDVADEIFNLYEYFRKNHSSVGLISDFVDEENIKPVPNFINEFKHTDKYYFNACRVPWRIAIDYAHYGTDEAKEITDRIAKWIIGKTNKDITKVAAGYNLDGSNLNSPTNNVAFIAPLLVSAITDDNSDNKDFLTRGWKDLKNIKGNDVYQRTIKLLSMMTISGNWWKPKGEKPSAGEGVILDFFTNAYNDASDQTNLGGAYGYCNHGGWQYAYKGGGYWSSYSDKGSKILSDGKEIDSFKEAVYPKDGLLKITLDSEGSDEEYPYAGFSCGLLKDGKEFFDFSKLTKIKIVGKGKGSARVSLKTKDVIDAYKEAGEDAWGYYGTIVNFEDDMRPIILDVSEFSPLQGSIPFEKKWDWDHGKDAVREFEISISGKNKTEMVIDSIVLVGLDYKVFGIDNYVSPEDVSVKTLKAQQNQVSVVQKGMNSIGLTYHIDRAFKPMNIEIFNLQGQKIYSAVKRHHAVGNHTIQINNNFVNGVYILKLTHNNHQYTQSLTFTK